MITSYAYTGIGGREINEDSHFFRQSDTHNVYVVCDGLGGHDKGEEASALVTDVFAGRFEEVTDENAESFIGDSLMIGCQRGYEDNRNSGYDSRGKDLPRICRRLADICI